MAAESIVFRAILHRVERRLGAKTARCARTGGEDLPTTSWYVAIPLLAVVSACATSPVISNGGVTPCHADDAYARIQIATLREVALARTPEGVAWRVRAHLPADTNVVLITDPSVCATARRAYERDADLRGKSAKYVYVLKMGDVFVVSNPSFPTGEFVTQFVYDIRFRLISAYLH